MAPRLLVLALFLLSVVAFSSGERGREIRRRVRSTSTTTTIAAPTAAPGDGVNDDKQICEGEPGCEWSCARDHPDPNTNCMCACTAPDAPREEQPTSYDGSYFGK